MSGRLDLDRELGGYLQARATSHAPDGLLDVTLRQIGATSQRPGSLVVDRWLPAQAQFRVTTATRVSARLALAALLIAIAVAVVVIVGSQRRLPPPFGLARPGLVAFDLGNDIYVAKPDGTGRTQLTSGPDADIRPTWSPDGTLIAFESEQADMSTSLIVMDADGRHRMVLADQFAEVGDISWSPDSRRLAFGGRPVGTKSIATGFANRALYPVYVAEIANPGAIALGGPDLYGEEPSWSPDGTKIAFKRLFQCCDGPSDGLWLMGADGSDPRRLSTTTGTTVIAFWNTAWSPDGKQLAFLAAGVNGAFDVYVVNTDGTGQRNISMSPEDEFWPSWSPDGRRIAFPRMSRDLNNAGSLVVVDPDGSHPVVLPGPYVNSNTPIWSPDGMRVMGYVKNPDLSLDYNVSIAVFDSSGRTPPVIIPAEDFGDASWQRLAP